MRITAACVLMMAAVPAACLAEEWTKHWDVSGTPEIHITTGDAAVAIRAGSGTGIDATIRTRGLSIGANGVRIEEHLSGNRLELTVKDPSHMLSFGGEHSIRVEVRVPQAIHGDVHTGDGPLSVFGVHGNLEAHTGDGPVKVEGFDGSFRAQTGDGPVTIGGRFQDLWVKTGDGPVAIEAAHGSSVGNGWHVQTGDGPVEVKVPSDLAANVELHSGDGPIRFDLPLTVSGSQDKHNVHGALNGGGAPLNIHTGDGPISIGRS